ncbi:MAG: NAD(P)-dependent oxidoreductase [Nannocystaceae bacterium]
MRILFTGASSFTGYWFVRALAEAGHEVVATFQRGAGEYTGIRGERVAELHEHTERVFECSFGQKRFLEVIGSIGSLDLLCHHAADVSNYKSADFDVLGATANNTANLPTVLAAIRRRGCEVVCLTGSVFEQDEGAGSEGLPAFSPYGLSKGITAQIVRYHSGTAGLRLGKFVIPNPFGIFEEPRFTGYLVRTWYKGENAAVHTPAYVRDNIHVSLLARAYSAYASELCQAGARQVFRPSGYPGTQGGFAHLFAENMRDRLGLPCKLDLHAQSEFGEPRVRINTDVLDHQALAWNERLAWDELAEYYRSLQ